LKNLLESFYSHLEKTPSKAAFIDYDQSKNYSWESLEKLSNLIADLSKDNLNYVLICTQHNIMYPAAIIGAWKSHSVPVMVHENYTEHELKQIQRIMGTNRMLTLVDESFELKIIGKYKKLFPNIILISEDLLGTQNSTENSEKVELDNNDFGIGLFTSGSSGPPKLCLFTHRDLYEGALIEKKNDKNLTNAIIANLRPHFTSAGLNTLWPALLDGHTNILAEKIRKTPINRFFQTFLESTAPTVLVLSPTFIMSLFQDHEDGPVSKYDLPLYFGGSSLPWQMLEKLMDNKFIPSMRYGMTEVSHIISKMTYTPDLASYDKADVGPLYSGFEIECDNYTLNIQSPGNATRVVGIRDIMDFEKPIFLETADKAKIVDGNRLLLAGRDNNSLTMYGFRFNSQQVEEVIIEHPSVLDCRVFKVKKEDDRDDRLVACILLRDDICMKKEIQELCQEMLSPFKWPQDYLFLKAWPKKANGKIDFNKLIEMSQELP